MAHNLLIQTGKILKVKIIHVLHITHYGVFDAGAVADYTIMN